eukprot:scaffold24326_cov36-Cyclotella_meneghiniana.AAC.1
MFDRKVAKAKNGFIHAWACLRRVVGRESRSWKREESSKEAKQARSKSEAHKLRGFRLWAPGIKFPRN